MQNSKTKPIIFFMMVYVIITIALIFTFVDKSNEYKEEINKRTSIMNSQFIECLENVNIKAVTAKDDGLPLFDRYIKSAENLTFASSLLDETSYAVYDDENLIGYRKYSGDWEDNRSDSGRFARSLRILALHLQECAKNEEKIDTEKADKIEDFLENIVNSLDDKEQCQEYMDELVEYVSGELNKQ